MGLFCYAFGVLSHFAGYYCTSSELAENSRTQWLVNLAFLAMAIICILLIRYALKHAKNAALQIIIYIVIGAAALTLLVGFFITSLVLMPHLCGNG